MPLALVEAGRNSKDAVAEGKRFRFGAYPETARSHAQMIRLGTEIMLLGGISFSPPKNTANQTVGYVWEVELTLCRQCAGIKT